MHCQSRVRRTSNANNCITKWHDVKQIAHGCGSLAEQRAEGPRPRRLSVVPSKSTPRWIASGVLISHQIVESALITDRPTHSTSTPNSVASYDRRMHRARPSTLTLLGKQKTHTRTHTHRSSPATSMAADDIKEG